MEWQKEDYTISTDKSRIDVAYVHAFLTQSYWAAGIPLNTVQRSIDGSICFSLFRGWQQTGFARMITDEATFAYLADVFIDENHRGKGLGKWLVSTILEYPSFQGLRRILLGTRDAHSLYRQFGFTALPSLDPWMQLHHPDVNKTSS